MLRVTLSLVFFPVVLFALLLLTARTLQLLPEPSLFNELSGAGPFFIFATYFLMGSIAVPLLLVALWRRWLEVWHFMVIGAAAGLLALALPLWSLLFDERLRLQYRLASLAEGYPFVILGIVGGALFWLLAFFRNHAFSAHRKPASTTRPAA